MFRWFWRLFVYITRSHRVSLCAQLWREEERRGRTSRRDIERWGRVSNLQRRWEKWPWLLNRTSEHFTCLRHCRLLFPVGGKEHLPSFEYTHINTAHMGHTHTYMNTYEWIHVLSRSRHFIIHNAAPPPPLPHLLKGVLPHHFHRMSFYPHQPMVHIIIMIWGFYCGIWKGQCLWCLDRLFRYAALNCKVLMLQHLIEVISPVHVRMG